MVVKREGSKTVLEAARKRIVNVFSNNQKVYVSFSGGKDSLCLLDIILKLIAKGKINPELLIVEFIDEEAMYDCVIETVKEWRKKVLLAGGQFNWFCLEVRHFSCFNNLEQEEGFICWDRTKKDVWVRQPPSFAIRKMPDALINRHKKYMTKLYTYQEFLTDHNKDGIVLTGVRMAESVQRVKYMTYAFTSKKGLAKSNTVWPIYDWKDTDIWRYLYEEKINVPNIYLYMYQSGAGRKDLRVSIFFSADVAKSLVKMNEYYPGLMDRIIKREPNAYLAALYWDSEMFKRSTKNRRNFEVPKDYKAEVYKMFSNPQKHFVTKDSMVNAKRIMQVLIKYGLFIEKDSKAYKLAYDCLSAGDPKGRTMRAIMITINGEYLKACEKLLWKET